MKNQYFLFTQLVLLSVICVLIECNSIESPPQNNIKNIISIQFSQPSYTFTLAQASAGIEIPYQIIIAENIDTIYARSGKQCPGRPDSSGLIPFEILSGNGQRYCLCDEGLCFVLDTNGVISKLVKGTYQETFSWQGHNWNGASDYNAPLGPAFPAGTYFLKIGVGGKNKVGNSFEGFSIADSVSVVLTN
jgi:hypothetical protein